jgi:hypothetical protein
LICAKPCLKKTLIQAISGPPPTWLAMMATTASAPLIMTAVAIVVAPLNVVVETAPSVMMAHNMLTSVMIAVIIDTVMIGMMRGSVMTSMMTCVVMISVMIGVVMTGGTMASMMIGVVMINVMMVNVLLHMLMLHVRYARYMATLLVTVGGVTRMTLMMMLIAMIRLFMLLPMGLIQTVRATYHITRALNKLSVHGKYQGHDRVHTAHGNGISIRHIGHLILHTTDKFLALKNIVHVTNA